MQTIQVTNDYTFNTSNAELNPICPLLPLLRAHHIFHVTGLRFNHNNHAQDNS